MSKFALASGYLIDLESDESIYNVPFDDIAHHLAKIQRFNGGSPLNTGYTVGEHSINLVNHARRVGGISRLGVKILLLHDASEALLADVVSPAKQFLPDYRNLEDRVQRLINRRFLGIVALIDESPKLKRLDKCILLDEVEHIMPEKLALYKQGGDLERLGCDILFNNHASTVKQCYLTVAKNLGVI